MKKSLIVHIGTHKTGSTSLQKFLVDNPRLLSQYGSALYRGQFHEGNHVELHLAAMHYERDSFAKQRLAARYNFDAQFTRRTAQRVRAYLARCGEPRIVFSSEGLSLLRHDDEIERLRDILDAESNDVTIVVYLRNKDDFLRSYIHQLHKVKERVPASDYWSALYVEPDTWLTDYESLVSAYQKGFGANSVMVIDYDEQMRTIGNVIPSFLELLGIRSGGPSELSAYFFNTTDNSSSMTEARWGQRARQAWLKWTGRRAA